MKRLILICLIVMYTFSSTQAYQLLKLPALIEHYFSHKNTDNNMNFYEFIKIHYLQKMHEDADFAKDQKLPFKSVENYASFACVAIADFNKYNLKPAGFFVVKKYKVENQNLLSALLVKGLFRPPRLA